VNNLNSLLLAAGIGLAIGNLLFEKVIFKGTWDKVFTRTYDQSVALFVVWVIQYI
jgi:uncharacterized membrane protein SpoIIM required for sporulation